MKTNLIIIGAICAIMASVSFGGTVVVSPSNMDSWAFYVTDSSGTIGTGTGTGEMVTVPATPPLGTGSAHLAPGSGDQSVQLRNSSWAGTRIDALTTLSYSTYATAWNGQQLPWLTIWLDTNGDSIKEDRLQFEPTYSEADAGNGNLDPQPDLVPNTWQTWNALNGMWYNESGSISGEGSNAITLTHYLSHYPNATIINDADQGIGGIRITSGFASPENNFNANVDNFSIGTAAGTTTYNFEVVPEPATIAILGLGALSLIRRKRNA